MPQVDAMAAACLARQQIQLKLDKAGRELQAGVIDDYTVGASQPAYFGNTVSGVELQGVG
jgi:predicted RNase H-like nuclease (RuvC/YqgF family)